MNEEFTTSVSHKQLNGMEWVEIVLFLSDTDYLDENRVAQWQKQYARVTVAAREEHPETLPEGIHWHSFEPGKVRSEIWNSLLSSAQKNWVLFLEDDESIRFSNFPDRDSLNDRSWNPAIIKQESGRSRQFYQMRLVKVPADPTTQVFDGRNLPDCTRYVRENDIELSNHPIVIERESSPIDHVDVDEELSVKNFSPKVYLIQGERYFRDKKYVRAAAQYRQLLKKEKLLSYDRLAGVNGLASCMTEQHKWSKALTLAGESLKAESLQSLPYLIQFRILELRKEWRKAHKILRQYYRCFSLYSRANFDRKIEEEEILVNLADVCLKAGNRKEATDYFKRLFSFKRDEIDRTLLKKVLVLSIELEDHERSIYLFERLFDDRLPDNLEKEEGRELDEIMTMFMQKEWYNYVSRVYTMLHNAYPENEAYKRKLVVTLTKTNRLDKAKKVVANIV